MTVGDSRWKPIIADVNCALISCVISSHHPSKRTQPTNLFPLPTPIWKISHGNHNSSHKKRSFYHSQKSVTSVQLGQEPDYCRKMSQNDFIRWHTLRHMMLRHRMLRCLTKSIPHLANFATVGSTTRQSTLPWYRYTDVGIVLSFPLEKSTVGVYKMRLLHHHLFFINYGKGLFINQMPNGKIWSSLTLPCFGFFFIFYVSRAAAPEGTEGDSV